MTVYKIRNKKTGKYSSGGSFPEWVDKGKSWPSTGRIRQHLLGTGPLTTRKSKRSFYSNAEVVVFEITEAETGTQAIPWEKE